MPSELPGFMDILAELIRESSVRGGGVHDAHLVGLMRQHRVETIWTYDRDFQRFEGVRAVEPGVAA